MAVGGGTISGRLSGGRWHPRMNLNRLFTSRLWSFVALTGGNRKGARKFPRDTDLRSAFLFPLITSYCPTVCLNPVSPWARGRLTESCPCPFLRQRGKCSPDFTSPKSTFSCATERLRFGQSDGADCERMPRALPSSVARRPLPSLLNRGETGVDEGLQQPATQSYVLPPRQHPSATDTGQPAVMMERAQATRAAGADDTAEERERLVRVAAIQPHPDLAHSWGAGSASALLCAGKAEGAGEGTAAGGACRAQASGGSTRSGVGEI